MRECNRLVDLVFFSFYLRIGDIIVVHHSLGAISFHFTRFASVCFFVKSHKEKEILNTSKGKHERGSNWIITSEDNGLERVEEDKNKLDKLESCEVLFPPEILLNLRSTSSQQVVEIHHCVNSGV